MELIKYLNDLKSCVVIRSTAGGGAGSIIKIELNKESSLNNEMPSFVLYIECAWRIENKNEVIATSVDNIEAVTGLIAKSAKALEGKVIDSVEITPFYDLRINFIDGFCIEVFCIFSYTYEFDTNWVLSIPYEDKCYKITNHFKVKKEKYS